MSHLDELFELFKEFAELGVKVQEQLVSVAVEGEEVSNQDSKAMESSLDFVNRVKRFFDEVDQDDVIGDLEALSSHIEDGLDDPDPDEKDTDDEEFSED